MAWRKLLVKDRREVKALDELLELNSILLAIFGISIFGSMRSLTKSVLKRQDEKKKRKRIDEQGASVDNAQYYI